jgi:nucleotide-binding universal stress UspA family protein
MYKHILVATDGSEISGRAVSHAIELAQKLKARLLITTITEPFHILSLGVEQLESTRPEYNRLMTDRAQTILSSAAKIASEARVECQIYHQSADNPYAAILNVANDRDCDLIVVGSHGRSGLSSVLLGSTTMKILAHSTIPILVVR